MFEIIFIIVYLICVYIVTKKWEWIRKLLEKIGGLK